jgi:hypothetical protein
MLNPKYWQLRNQAALLGVCAVALLGIIGYIIAYGPPETPIGKIFLILTALFLNVPVVVLDALQVIDTISLIHRSRRRQIGLEKPPATATFLLYLLLSKYDRETLPGDLEEEFTTVTLPKFGPYRAWLWYWVQALWAIAYRNLLCRWLLVGGGIFKLGEWVTQRLRG